MATTLSNEQKAMLYAAMKTAERALDVDGELPPGFSMDVSGKSVTITFPPGSVVERDKGTNGDGTMLKKAVQNLYGYATWALMVQRLMKFHQWNQIRASILQALREVIRRPSRNVREQITRDFPDAVAIMDALQMELEIPPRTEETPRIFKEPELPATLTFRG
jgi:hypothetical protein